MEVTSKSYLKPFAFAAAACLFALGAAKAYAEPVMIERATLKDDTEIAVETPESKIEIHKKQAISTAPVVIVRNFEPLTQLSISDQSIPKLHTASSVALKPINRIYDADMDLRNFDLVEDNPIFIGARSPSEFDKLDNLRDRGAYPEGFDVDPLYTVAGAGISARF